MIPKLIYLKPAHPLQLMNSHECTYFKNQIQRLCLEQTPINIVCTYICKKKVIIPCMYTFIVFCMSREILIRKTSDS